MGILDGEQVVGMVATVRPIKDYDTFLRAAHLILKEHPRTRFLAIGSQEANYAQQMRKLAGDL
jgi:glycosyltransferase involved in cell wall biosynthesis